MLYLEFKTGEKTILSFSLSEEPGSKAENIVGDDNWFDYDFRPYSKRLGKDVSIKANPEEWAMSLGENYAADASKIYVLLTRTDDLTGVSKRYSFRLKEGIVFDQDESPSKSKRKWFIVFSILAGLSFFLVLIISFIISISGETNTGKSNEVWRAWILFFVLFAIWIFLIKPPELNKKLTSGILVGAVICGLAFASPIAPKLNPAEIPSQTEGSSKTTKKAYGVFQYETPSRSYLNGESGYPMKDVVVNYRGIIPPFASTLPVGPADGSVGDLDSERGRMLADGVLVERVEDYQEALYTEEYYAISWGKTDSKISWIYWVFLIVFSVLVFQKYRNERKLDQENQSEQNILNP